MPNSLPAAAGARTVPSVRIGRPALFAVFFLSGAAALVYQVAWQRALLTVFGTNIESVTIVVAAFMVGLGLGSLAGGALSRDPARPVLPLFAGIELAIGAWGLVSLRLISAVAGGGVGTSLAGVGVASFLLVLFPTLLMGATLPLLVAHLVRVRGHVGRAVSWLYAVNTLGAAVGSVVAALLALGVLGLAGTVQAAAGVNAVVATGVAAAWAVGRRGPRT